MGQYSIKDLEKMSGIKAHTLRIWEKRYNLICPERTKTNIRHYSDDDLKKILNISILNKLGFRISKIVELSNEELNARVIELTENQINPESDTDRLIASMIELDELQFERLLSSLVLKYGFEKTFTEIVYSFLDKIGILWQTGNINPAHEHFVSNLIRQKLMVAIDALPIAPYSYEKSFTFFLPEGELHELGLLFSNYLIRKAGFSTFYLGQSVPLTDLQTIIETRPTKSILTAFITPIPEDKIKGYLERLSKSFPKCQIYISGFQVSYHNLESHSNIKIVRKSTDLKDLVSF